MTVDVHQVTRAAICDDCGILAQLIIAVPGEPVRECCADHTRRRIAALELTGADIAYTQPARQLLGVAGGDYLGAPQ